MHDDRQDPMRWYKILQEFYGILIILLKAPTVL